MICSFYGILGAIAESGEVFKHFVLCNWFGEKKKLRYLYQNFVLYVFDVLTGFFRTDTFVNIKKVTYTYIYF